MHNYKLTIAYDGTGYCGWQTQTSAQTSPASFEKRAQAPQFRTVQEEIERALRKVLGEKIRLTGSGRTDSGVHAVAQIAHFKTKKSIPLQNLMKALNGVLGRDICIREAQEVSSDFHARFSARRKIYRYCIMNTQDKPLFIRHGAAWVRHPLDVAAMRRASRFLVGRHDFKSFQASDRTERKSVTSIGRITVKSVTGPKDLPFIQEGKWIVIDVEGSGFLRSMVRNIVGTLLDVGKGKRTPQEMRSILKKKDRRFAGPCASAAGLYLMDVLY
jgi:tRNA pseudouridine38-40 synthase